MAGQDGTGPNGMGPMTGRGLGPCGAGLARARGCGRGFGRGRGFGQGMGQGFQFQQPKMTDEQEKVMLEQELEATETAQKNIQERLNQLE